MKYQCKRTGTNNGVVFYFTKKKDGGIGLSIFPHLAIDLTDEQVAELRLKYPELTIEQTFIS